MLTQEKIKLASQAAPQLAKTVVSEMKSGKRSMGLEWSDEVVSGKSTLKEMIGTDDGASDFLEKTTYDVYQGREAIPLVYKDIYTTKEDRSFPRVMIAKEYGPVQTVFLEKLEGEEVRFGSLGAGVEKVVRFHTYAAGLEWSEDMVEYNEYWSLTDAAASFGESYNKLLNHLHMSPIISASYTTTSATASVAKAAQEAGTPQLIAWNTDVKTTIQQAFDVLPLATQIIVNSGDLDYLERNIATDILADNSEGPTKRRFNALQKVVYDGDEVTVDGEVYTYTGVAAGFAYMLVPKRQFTEYIKHDLLIDDDSGDLSRLIVAQMVGRARRAVFAGLSGKYGVIKVDIRA